MATTLNDFNKSFRSIKCYLYLDINNTDNYVDYSDQLDEVNWIETLNSALPCGIVEVQAEVIMNLLAYSPELQKSGINVKIVLSISSDNWISSVDQTVFWGTTNDNTSVTDRSAILKCVGATTTFLKRKNVFGAGTSITLQDIAQLISNEASTASMSIGTFENSTHQIENVFRVPDNNYSVNINQLCLAGNYLLRQQIGTQKTAQGLSSLGSLAVINDSTIPTYTLDQIINYQTNRNKSYTYNRLKNKAYIRKYYTNTQLYVNKNITGIEIKANSTLYYIIDDKDQIDYFDIQPFTAFTGSETVSYYQCATADDGTGLSNAGITLNSAGIVNQNGKTKILIKLNNTNASSRWLKYVGVYGFAGFIVNNIIENDDRDTTLINQDGKEYFVDYDSRYIQSQAQSEALTSELLANYSSNKMVYEFVAKGLPTVQVGDVVKFQTRDLIYHYGKILELDSEISRNRGFEQTILVKEV